MNRRPIAVSLVACSLLVGAGCNIVGPALYFIKGPEKVPAQYTLDKERSIVVFIDDRANQLPRRSLRTVIAKAAQDNLLAQKIVSKAVDARSAYVVASQERSEDPMNLADLGRSVEAEIVLYATIDRFTITPDGASLKPTIEMRVKVIDVLAEERLWPEEKEGFKLPVNGRVKQGFVPKSSGDMAKLEEDAAKQAGLALAQLFYAYEPRRGAEQER